MTRAHSGFETTYWSLHVKLSQKEIDLFRHSGFIRRQRACPKHGWKH